jgi:hypothetical protein
MAEGMGVNQKEYGKSIWINREPSGRLQREGLGRERSKRRSGPF